MLLVIDVGNTNTVLGLFDGQTILDDWRIETRKGRTADELGLLIQGLFTSQGRDVKTVTATAISSVVPSMRRTLEQACQRYLGVTPMVVGPGIKTGMAILMDNPREVGADRIVNAVAAWEKYHQPLVVVDFGTATTFDCVSQRGEYMGGIIAPGYQISAEALFRQTSKLPRVDLTKPKRVIGKNTIGGMQSGLFYGYVGLVDGLVRRVLGEMGRPAKVVATGGLALLFAEASETLDAVEEHLTLHGLRIIWERNREA